MSKKMMRMLFLLMIIMGISCIKPEVAQAAPQYTSLAAESVTTSTVTVRARVAPDTWITSCGLYFGTSTGNMRVVTSENVNKWTNNIWYTAGKDFYYLSSNTTYYYKFYFVANGQTYYSTIGNFRTKSNPHFVWSNKGLWYDNGNGTYPKNCWKYIDGYWYYFNQYGYARSGWSQIGGKWYYFNTSSHKMLTGMIYVKGHYYYLDSSGAMCTGWKKINGYWYHFTSSGIRQHGWCKISGKWYYMNSSGVMRTGWLSLNGHYYYLNGSGAMCTGWKQIGSYWYCFTSSGARRTGWCKSFGKWYYLNSSGVMQTGWVCVSGKYYYMTGSGVMCTGWKKIGGYWYYMNSSGARLSNTCVGGYYLGYNGKMLSGNTTTGDLSAVNNLYNITTMGLSSNVIANIGRPSYYTGSFNQYMCYENRYYWGRYGLMTVGLFENRAATAEWSCTFGGDTAYNRNQCRELCERIGNAVYYKFGSYNSCSAASNGATIHWNFGYSRPEIVVRWSVRNGNPEVRVTIYNGQ